MVEKVLAINEAIKELYKKLGIEPCGLDAYVEKDYAFTYKKNTEFVLLDIKNFVEYIKYNSKECDEKELILAKDEEKIILARYCGNYYENPINENLCDYDGEIKGYIVDKKEKKVYFFNSIYAYKLQIKEFITEDEEINIKEIIDFLS